MTLLDRIFKDSLEQKAGRIHFYSNNWVLTYTNADYQKMFKRNTGLYSAQKGKLITRKDNDGKDVFLIHQRAVCCRNADLCKNKGYAHFKEDKLGSKWWYPAKDCKKCRHYKPADQRGSYRFPRCMFQSSQEPGMAAIKETFGIIDKAKEEVNKVMGL